MSEHAKDLLKAAAVGVLLAATTSFLGSYLLGGLSDGEATDSLREIRSTLRFSASGTMTATATILALMLTLLSFSNNTDERMKGWHYERIRWIARLTTGTFIGALILLMLLNIPINNAEETFNTHYNWVYYIILGYVSLLGGAMITIILTLYRAAADIILVMHPNTDADFIFQSDEEDDGSEDENQDEQRDNAKKNIQHSSSEK